LVETIAGYVAIALDNSQLYSSLEQKVTEIARLKDFSENIVESLNVGVLAVDLEGLVNPGTREWSSYLAWHASKRRASTEFAAARRIVAGD